MRLMVATLLIAFEMTAMLQAQETPALPTELTGKLAKLQPLVGTWEITAEWADGTALWGRTEYRPGLGGKFLEADTYAKDGDGEVYHRYKSLFGYDAESKQFMTYGFIYDGSQMTIPVEVTDEGGQLAMNSSWTMGTAQIRQKIKLISPKKYTWKVMMAAASEGEWSQIMDGEWQKVK